MKIDKKRLIYIFLLIQPIIDLITSVMTRFEVEFVSVGIIIRGLFILCMLIYLLFFCNTKYKKISLLYVFFLFVYIFLFFISKTELLFNISFLVDNTIYLFKYMYFLFLFITMFNFYIQYQLDYKKIINIFLVDLLLYAFFIILPYLTNTSFSSYAQYRGEGVVGWFFAANDISVILISLFPLIIYKLDEEINLCKVILAIVVIFSCLLIGTKVAYFGIILCLIFVLAYYLFFIKKKWKNILLLISILGFTILMGYNSSVFNNIKNRIDKYEEYHETGTNKNENEEEIVVQKEDTKMTIVILSSRDKLLRNTYNIYKNRSIAEKLLGIGFSNRPSVDDERIEKLVEMDVFDILFHGGIVLFIVYFVPFITIFIVFIKYVLTKKKISLYGWMLGYLIILVFGVSTLSGHVFSSPSVLVYYTSFLVMFLDCFKVEDKVILKKKITFLLLHLGNGGIERSTVNTANALSKYFDIELVVAYKLIDKPLYEINDAIKIKYLIDNDVALRTLKYKERIKSFKFGLLCKDLYSDYVKKKKIFNLFIDIYDSVKVSILKIELMRKYLQKCDSDIIISTRVEYSLLLSKYGNINSVKIAVEHRHHNNDKKYIKKIRNGYDKINYLVVLTKKLQQDYKSFLKNDSKTEVVTIPNMLINYPKKLSSLKNKRIISIGRIVMSKKVDEIVEIASFLDKSWEFIIIGDGDKFNDVNKLIKKNDLSNVKMLGSMKNDDALKCLKESSIFIMTSETEGLPMVLLEAFSCGVPVVSYLTDSGVADIVDDGLNGFVIANRNQKEMIAKLKMLMEDFKQRKKMGKNAYHKSLEFSETEIVDKWLQIL